jgi:hypothetical protein
MTKFPIKNLLAGAAAGTVASLVQAAVGATQSAGFAPDGENANIAPRLMSRLANRAGARLTFTERWSLGTLYHLGYGAGWGVLYAAARERVPVHPLLGGALLGGLIYGITFPRWGGAVRLDVERDPAARTPQMEVVLASVTLSFGLSAAYLYERLREAA